MIVFNFTYFRQYNLKTIDKILVRYQMSLKNGISDVKSEDCLFTVKAA